MAAGVAVRLEGTGEVRRAMDVARDGDPAAAGLPRTVSEDVDAEMGCGREGDDACRLPDIFLPCL